MWSSHGEKSPPGSMKTMMSLQVRFWGNKKPTRPPDTLQRLSHTLLPLLSMTLKEGGENSRKSVNATSRNMGPNLKHSPRRNAPWSHSLVMEQESKQEMCFLCLKPLSQHSHGIKTIPHANLNVLMSHWSVISSKQSCYNCICCKHFKDHDDLLFKFTHVSYPGLRQLEVKWMCFYWFLVKWLYSLSNTLLFHHSDAHWHLVQNPSTKREKLMMRRIILLNYNEKFQS